MPARLVEESLLVKGQTIVIVASAGSRLAGKSGIVTGKGATRSQVRVLLDGSKCCITLHARFLGLPQGRALQDPADPLISQDGHKEKKQRQN